MRIPKKLLYSQEHLWVKREGKGKTVKIGITEYITSSDDLEEISIDDIEEAEVSAGDIIGEVITSQGSFELISPVSGKVVSINREAIENPDIISEMPYSEGWLIEIETDGDLSSFSLLTAEEYEELINSI